MPNYIKATSCIRRRPDLSVEEFTRYWTEDHGPLVKSVAEALGAKKYVQNHLLRGEMTDVFTQSRGGTVEPYDGVVMVWFDADDTEMTDERLAANIALLEDEANFIDRENSAWFFTVEHVVIDGDVD